MDAAKNGSEDGWPRGRVGSDMLPNSNDEDASGHNFESVRRAKSFLIRSGIIAFILFLISSYINSRPGGHEVLGDFFSFLSAISLITGTIVVVSRIDYIPRVTPIIIIAGIFVAFSQSINLMEEIPFFKRVPFIGPEGAYYYNHADDLFLYFGLGLLILTSFFSFLEAVTTRKQLLVESRRKDRALSDREAATAALQESETRYRNLVDHSPVSIIVHQRGTIVFANDAGLKMIGATDSSQILGRSILDFVTPEQRAEVQDRVTRVMDPSGPVTLESMHQLQKRKLFRLDGGEVHVEVAVTPVPYQGQPAVQAVLIDVTDRERAEEQNQRLEAQLRHSQKMEAIGTLAGGIAHDFNNLLTGILGYADILLDESRPGEPVHRAAEVIGKAAGRAADLTRQLLGFARKGKLQNLPVDLHDLVLEVTHLLSRTIDKSITIRRCLDVPRPMVLGDPGQIQQVVLNLALNARDAMPASGGEITFSTNEQVFTDSSDGSLRPAQPGRYMVLSVSDNGSGIPKECQNRVFEPFFTTKALGKGTGMGLAMVYGIVQNHGGTISFTTTEGRGTTFRVYLPFAPESASGQIASTGSRTLQRGKGRIMIVDDEEVVRLMASRMLEQLGYEVTCASDGSEAVESYKSCAAAIDLVLLDMIMPNMGGRECFRSLKAINPGVRAVLSTGYGRDSAAQEIMDEGMMGFIQKPYTAADLSQVVAGAMRAYHG